MSTPSPHRKLLNRLTLGLLVTASVLMTSVQAQAAERVVLRYRFLRESISVPELATFAETGRMSPKLRFYMTVSRQDPNELRRTLTQETAVDGVLLSRILNSYPGELALDQISEVIHTPNREASRQALRSAVVSSALSDGKITVIEVLQNYPTAEVHVDGDRLVSVVNQLSNLARRIPNIPNLPNLSNIRF